ncbi:hypothetical protein DFLDMN_002276 [Cupriavidus sp. H19C3]|uniref:hypothetical protein n=1 Tax=Cupriavidus sp. H19C3 TaxID=3241603 RepID=UPI003BF8738C
MSRNLFFKRNQVRTHRVALATAALLGALTAATVFLCVRPALKPAAAATMPQAAVGQSGAPDPQRAGSGDDASMASMALESGKLVTLADRHASDAMRMAAEGTGAAHDDLGWDYVQLRL